MFVLLEQRRHHGYRMYFLVFLFITLAAATPRSSRRLTLSPSSYPPSTEVFSGSAYVVDILVPPNSLNSEQTSKSENRRNITDDVSNILFVVQAYLKNILDYQGLFAVKPNDDQTLLLSNGQCSTYGLGDKVYFGAKDGIYKYNKNDNKAEKYGTVTESVIKMATDPNTGTVYYLTEDFDLYKFDKDEVKSSKVDAVKDARDMVFDYESNLYFHDGERQVYVYDGEKVKKIEGLPAHSANIKLIVVNSPFGAGTFALVDVYLYKLTKAGTSEKTFIEFQTVPTAFANYKRIYEYFAYDRKVYRVNLFSAMDMDSLFPFRDLFVSNEPAENNEV